ncbi:hypothetical protein DFA_08326 [Cavenderia fasciculata]|uniref:Uncharacterized protein n=1 Tax=Cavenderia fasciculata TaxID=261658 RepID=F4Q5S2_CACFS|nr:uncharacterized protein DFA_08326 [Cavenderia fasciculata]EGG17331.1 hypothetical protein DFA_08326 [Cavenderia fasciculata]|eukprot:XP_004355815.1 hypothetical protein DFA_08326 [Cavenderia fasciculata]
MDTKNNNSRSRRYSTPNLYENYTSPNINNTFAESTTPKRVVVPGGYLEPINNLNEYKLDVFNDTPHQIIEHPKPNKQLFIQTANKVIINNNQNQQYYKQQQIEKEKLKVLKKKKKNLDHPNHSRHNHTTTSTPWSDSIDMNNIFQSKPPHNSEKAKEVLINIQRVALDFNGIMDRNDQSLRLVISKLMTTTRNLVELGSYKELADDIRLIGEIIIKSGYFLEICKLFAKLLSELKNTDETIHFVLEFKKMVGVINNLTKAIEDESQTIEMFTIEADQRQKIIKSLKNLLNYILRNKEMILIVKNIENLRKQVQIAKEEQKKSFSREALQEVMKDAPILNEMLLAVQSIIGSKLNVKLLMANIRDLIAFVKVNQGYKQNIEDVNKIVNQIYSMEDLEMNESMEFKSRNLIDRFEQMLIEICALPSVIELRIQLSLLTTSLRHDELNLRFIEDLKNLFHSMLKKDSKYRIDYKVLNQLKELLIPYLINKIRIIPLPTITNINQENLKDRPKTEFKLDGINIKFTFLDPKSVQFGLVTCVQSNPFLLSGTVSTLFTIELTNIHLKLENFQWYFKKRTIPRLKDEGFATVSTGTRGVDLKFKIAFSKDMVKDNKFLQNVKTKCTIYDTKLEILKSKHNKLYKTIFKMFEKKIKKELEKAIEKKLTELIIRMEQSIYETLCKDESTKIKTISAFSNPDGSRVTTTTTTTTTSNSASAVPSTYSSSTSSSVFNTKEEKRNKILGRIHTEVPRSSELRRVRERSKTLPDSPISPMIETPPPTKILGLSSPAYFSDTPLPTQPAYVSVTTTPIATTSKLPVPAPNSTVILKKPFDEQIQPPLLPIGAQDTNSFMVQDYNYEPKPKRTLSFQPQPVVVATAVDSSSSSSPLTYSRNDSYNKDFQELDDIFLNKTNHGFFIPPTTEPPPTTLLHEVKELNPKLYHQITKVQNEILKGNHDLHDHLNHDNINDNGDTICLLLTCKKLFSNSSLRRSIGFKGIRVFNDNGYISKEFKATATLFKLLSFNDILKNSISDRQVLLPVPDQYKIDDYPQWIKDRITLNNRVDKSTVTTVLVKNPQTTTYQSIYDIPSIETLFIEDKKSGIFPSSLTSLTIKLKEIPPRDTFLSLTSLVKLKLFFTNCPSLEQQPYIDLDGLANLKKLIISDHNPNNSLLYARGIKIPSHCSMPQLEKLYIQAKELIDGRINLQSQFPSLKKLVIDNCKEIIPPTIVIPSTVKSLKIYHYAFHSILGRVVLPPSLTHLSILGFYEPVILPDSLIKLNQTVKGGTPSLLQPNLKKLVWGTDRKTTSQTNIVLPPSSNNYPPNLETLNLVDLEGEYTIDTIPPTIKYLTIPLKQNTKHYLTLLSNPPIYSISSKISNNKTIVSQQQQQWLPLNTTHLTCQLLCSFVESKLAFRLDEVINHTNVRYLTLYISQISSDITFNFKIQRLDNDNLNVLVLETQTLQGGIITQRKCINNQQQQQQEYDPIYLYYNPDSPNTPFELKWIFS